MTDDVDDIVARIVASAKERSEQEAAENRALAEMTREESPSTSSGQ